VALHHLAGDLCVARLVGADEADDLEAGKEQESAKGNQRQYVGGAAGAVVERLRIFLFGESARDGYCTLS
jgi:hypothetical protein